MLRYIFFFLILPFYLYSQTVLKFESEGMNLKLENVLSGNEVIWGMTFISSSKLIFTLKSGKIILLDINTKKIKQVLASPNIFYGGQGGLLDVQASPTFKKDRLLYFTYVKKIDDKAVTVLAQANLEVYELKNWKDLLVSKSSSKTSRHFGSRITFDENGHIYFSIGDRGVRKNAQDLSNHAGTIVRLNLDGTIPSDNPFINQKNKLPEIYSYGHRNPQGLFYDKFSKNLWSIEHGPRGGDEINLIKKGLNYGWPVISHGKEYWGPISVGEGTHKEGMVQAKKVYTPSIAPSSLIIYNHNTFSKWKGNLFSGALKLRHLNRIVVNKSNEVIKEERLLEKLEQRIRNVIQSPTGDLYISTDNGNIFKIVPDT